MNTRVKVTLTPEQETLLITLYAKAQPDNPLFFDPTAQDILDYLPLAVKMDRRTGRRQFRHAQHVMPDQVLHHNVAVPLAVAQWPARNSADVLLELADGAAVLGPVARIMDARSDLVHDQALGRHEELDPHHANIVEMLHERPKHGFRLLL